MSWPKTIIAIKLSYDGTRIQSISSSQFASLNKPSQEPKDIYFLKMKKKLKRDTYKLNMKCEQKHEIKNEYNNLYVNNNEMWHQKMCHLELIYHPNSHFANLQKYASCHVCICLFIWKFYIVQIVGCRFGAQTQACKELIW
jgi:hypothetical protein